MVICFYFSSVSFRSGCHQLLRKMILTYMLTALSISSMSRQWCQKASCLKFTSKRATSEWRPTMSIVSTFTHFSHYSYYYCTVWRLIECELILNEYWFRFFINVFGFSCFLSFNVISLCSTLLRCSVFLCFVLLLFFLFDSIKNVKCILQIR